MILIRNGTVVDGSGKSPRRADILVRGNRIAAIGSFPRTQADTVIDALGLTVAPGFIDVHTESDHYLTLFTEPEQADFLKQGITTIVGGLCGASLAPLLYGSLEAIRKWGDPNEVNVSWHTFGEFVAAMQGRKFGVNFGTLAGHATIRRAIVGDDLRDLTTPELTVFRTALRRALREGALGFSTGLAYSHSRGTPYRELQVLAKVLREEGGVYATHLRSEHAGFASAIAEAVRLAEDVAVPTVITHYRPFVGYEREYERGLKHFAESRAAERIYFDSAPTEYSTAPFYRLLPVWAQRGTIEHMCELVKDRHNADRIVSELVHLDPEHIVILRARGADYLTGKTVGEFARNQNLDAPRALLRLMDVTALQAVALLKNVNLDWVIQGFRSPHALVGSSRPSMHAGDAHLDRFRVNAMTAFLDAATGLRICSLPEAIARITSVPASLYRIPERGLIREGMIADIAVLRGSEAVHVVVGGALAVRDKALTHVRNGVCITRA